MDKYHGFFLSSSGYMDKKEKEGIYYMHLNSNNFNFCFFIKNAYIFLKHL